MGGSKAGTRLKLPHTKPFSALWRRARIGNRSACQNGFIAKIHDNHLPAPVGTLSVSLAPPQAIAAGAQWRRLGTTAWFDSGTTEAGVPAGYWPIEFKPVADWNVLTSVTVIVNRDQSATTSGTYALQVGAIQMKLLPAEAAAAGAKWRRVGTETWLASGASEANLPPGNYTVEFLAVRNWKTPASMQVTVSSGQTTQVTGNYSRSAVDGSSWNLY